MERFDLHVHSTASDGTDSPEQLPVLARQSGLSGLALTDHDTLDGVACFMAACEREGMRGISGVEISSSGPGDSEVHILGYFRYPANNKLRQLVAFLKKARDERNRRMIRRLQELGATVTLSDWADEAGGHILGRLHLASLLVRTEFCTGYRHAFTGYIGRGGAAFVPKERLTSFEAATRLREAGAVPVLAHPGLIRSQVSSLRQFLIDLKENGLLGMECYHSDHQTRDVPRYLRLAAQLDLLATGGSDYHGTVKPHVRLGEPAIGPEIVDHIEALTTH